MRVSRIAALAAALAVAGLANPIQAGWLRHRRPAYSYQYQATTCGTTACGRTAVSQTTVQVTAGDPASFMAALNATRAQHGLAAVVYDANLAGWAAANNVQQAAHGLGHYVNPNYYQNAGMCAPQNALGMWLNSPGHRDNLLRPHVRKAGVAFNGQWATINLR